ncbi:MAG: energy-coupling factor transporter ATPase [Desulfurococcaceae archaeon]
MDNGNQEANESAVIISNVWFKYSGTERHALKNINLDVKKGEVVLITGRNGAGKSTLCYLLSGLIPHFYSGILDGSVKILGYDTRRTPVSFLSTKVGLLFSEPASQLLTSSVEDEIAFPLENLGLSIDVINKKVDEILKLLGLEKYRSNPPYTLSGGEQQLVALGSVLAMEPEIYVLDEPTSALDPLGTMLVIDYLKKIATLYGKTFIIVEHKIEEFMNFASRLLVMDEGKIIADGRPRDIILKHVKELEKLGLELPQITLFAVKLLDIIGSNCLNLPQYIPFTIEEGMVWLREILRACRSGKGYKNKLKVLEGPNSAPSSGDVSRSEPIVIIDNVTFIYPGTNTIALREVSLEISKGDMVAIIGHNGSGKTTLAKHINGLLKPTRGRVLVFGLDTRATPSHEIVKRVGYVFQDPDKQLFASKVYDEIAYGLKNLKLPKEEIGRRVQKAAKWLGIEHLLNESPYSLGRGDRQRVAIASVIAMEPEVIIFDEPTTGQDPVDRRQVMEIAKQLNSLGKTVIFITHDMHLVAEYARRVIVMDNGKIIMDGPPRTVFERVEDLKKIRLRPPSITELFVEMKKEGYGVSRLPLRVDEAINIFLELIS